MNDNGGDEPLDPTEQTQPISGPWGQQAPPSSGAPMPPYGPPNPQYAAPTWQWAGTYPPGQPPMGQPQLGQPPVGQWPQPTWGGPWQGGQPGQPPVGTRPRRSTRFKVLSAAAALVLLGGAAAGGAAFGAAHSGSSSSATGIVGGTGGTQAPQGQSPLIQPPSNGGQHAPRQHAPRQRSGAGASRFSTPGFATTTQGVGVVDINTNLKYQGARAAGTGMILTSDGEILTNNHVVEGATAIKVTVVSTGQRYVATVVGTDKVDDVALLHLTGASGLSTVHADTTLPSVGDHVTAVGNAMGAGGVPRAAKGTVTGVNRSITTQSEQGVDGERLTGMIRVDAQVIAGDSGGPLYNADDQVVGMDTAASSDAAASTGFAIPIAKALSIATQMQNGQEGGNITLGNPAFLGVQFDPTSPADRNGAGALVSGVLRNTPAARAGLIAGDTITRVNGTGVTSGDQLRTVLSQYNAGQSVALTWTDTRGSSHTASVTLMSGPAE